MDMKKQTMTRRQAIARVTALLGGAALVGGAGLLRAAAGEREYIGGDGDSGLFSREDVAWLDEVAETLLPQTDTPGAKAAGVGPFMALMVNDVYAPDEQQLFTDGMQRLEEACRAEYGKEFLEAAPAERLALLERIDREQHAYMQARTGDTPVHYFRMMKELALLGYFTSEVGYTQAMRYVETPGRYDPCTPHAPGERIWARHL
jgi:hypothetical protein